MKTFDFDLEFLKRLRKRNFIVLYNTDDEVRYEFVSKTYAQLADFVVTHDYASINKFQQIGLDTFFNPLPYSRNDYYPLPDIKKTVDVSFLGKISKVGRKESLDFIRSKCINIETFGSGEGLKYLRHEEVVKLYNESKINLNFTGVGGNFNWYSKYDPTFKRTRQIKGKPVQVLLTKSFLLSEYVPFLEKVFEIGKEIDVFYNKEDLLHKIEYYLKNEDLREEIASRGYERAIRYYEMDALWKNILNSIMESYNKVNWEERKFDDIQVFVGETFKKNYATFRFWYIAQLIIHKKYKHIFRELRDVYKMGRFRPVEAIKFFSPVVKHFLGDRDYRSVKE